MADVSERKLIELHGALAGPTVIFVGSLHGNEPAGAQALRRLGALLADREGLRGDVWGFVGNVRALKERRRFLSRDLNRRWNDAVTRAQPSTDDAEALEQQELWGELRAALAQARGPVFLVDLHSTSAPGIPFALTADTLPHRDFAAHFPLPTLLGLEEQVDGVLTEWMSAQGCVTLVVEGGQNEDPATLVNLEAVVWLALVAARVLDEAAVPEAAQAYATLNRARGTLPQFIEVLGRRALSADSAFRMEPGFANIEPVREGQLLAHDKHGEIRASSDGFVLMPLYQRQGDDGFFFGREVSSLSLGLARVSRQLKLDALLPLLPGVEGVGANRLKLGPAAVEAYPPSVFRLFGYRRSVRTGDSFELVRRPAPSSPRRS